MWVGGVVQSGGNKRGHKQTHRHAHNVTKKRPFSYLALSHYITVSNMYNIASVYDAKAPQLCLTVIYMIYVQVLQLCAAGVVLRSLVYPLSIGY